MLDTEERYGDNRHTKSYPKRKLLPEFDDEASHQKVTRPGDQKYHFTTAINQLPKTPTIYVSTWIRKLAQLGPSTGLKDTPRRGTMVIKTIITIKYQFGLNTGHNNSRRHAIERPDTGASHPLCFTDEVLDHEFPQGFKPVNIEAYDRTTDPGGLDRGLYPAYTHGSWG